MDTWNRLSAVRRAGDKRDWMRQDDEINQKKYALSMDIDNSVEMVRGKGRG